VSVYVRLSKGLGNQMFQYAAGLSLARHLGEELVLDVESLQNDPPWTYRLDEVFGIDDHHIADAGERAQFDYGQVMRRVALKTLYRRRFLPMGLPYEMPWPVTRAHLLYNRFRPTSAQRTYWEPHFEFDRTFFDAASPVILIGYWQSWRYSVDHLDEVRSRFTVRPELVAGVADLAEELRTVDSLALHVRLGDRGDPRFSSIFTPMTAEYYRGALDLVRREHPGVAVYLFSDDPESARRIVPADLDVTVVSGRASASDSSDLHLMSQCRHVVISNSSFSWWAARLRDPARGGTVVAPQDWYATRKYRTHDLYPPEWLTAPV